MTNTAVTTHALTLYLHRVSPGKWHGEAVCTCGKWEESYGGKYAMSVTNTIGAHFGNHYLRSVR